MTSARSPSSRRPASRRSTSWERRRFWLAMLDKKTAGTHAKVRYRCFLPDLAGFTSPRCPDHKFHSERVGFEPTIPFQIYTRSRRAPSAARPSLLHGERRIRTYGTVPGTPDFASGSFYHSTSSPPIPFSSSFKPWLPEESHDQFAAFIGPHTSGSGQPMAVASFIDEVVQRTGRSHLPIL